MLEDKEGLPSSRSGEERVAHAYVCIYLCRLTMYIPGSRGIEVLPHISVHLQGVAAGHKEDLEEGNDAAENYG